MVLFGLKTVRLLIRLKNLRFNQSLPTMLANVEKLTQVQRCGSSVIPGCGVKDFHFSSVTDSV